MELQGHSQHQARRRKGEERGSVGSSLLGLEEHRSFGVHHMNLSHKNDFWAI